MLLPVRVAACLQDAIQDGDAWMADGEEAAMKKLGHVHEKRIMILLITCEGPPLSDESARKAKYGKCCFTFV